MANSWLVRWSFFAVALIILIGIIFTLAHTSRGEGDWWFPGALAGILACLAASVLLVGREAHVAAVLSLLLASLASIIGIRPYDSNYPPGMPINSAWNGFLWLAPFLFVHLSLIFPVPNRWIERDLRRLSLLYVPYFALLLPLE